MPTRVQAETGASVSVHVTDGSQAPVAARELAARLRRAVGGEVRFDSGSRALYATDASNYRQMPIGVVIPRDGGDVTNALALCRRFEAPVVRIRAGSLRGLDGRR